MNLDEALVQTIGKAELPARLEDLGEFALDRVLSEVALRDLPVIGLLVGAVKTGRAVRDYFFMRKVLKFLAALGDVQIDVRLALARKLDTDSEFSRHAGVEIVALVDRLDDESKAQLVARAFAAYARGLVDVNQLRRLLYAIERMLISDLTVLQEMDSANSDVVYNCELPAVQSFVAAGLFYVASGFGVGGVRPTETMDLMNKFVLGGAGVPGDMGAST